MNLNLIKILGIFLVTMCCIIATYTDVKSQTIPNKLTFSLFLIGIVLGTFYFYKVGSLNIFYYCSILLVYLFSYVLWYFGVWAGGDVKLFTAISTILIPEFLVVIPNYKIFNIVMPLNLLSFKIPTFLLIFNSVLSIVPIIIVMVIYKIFIHKPYLIDEFKKTINFKEVLLSLNSLIISYIIISELNVYNPMLKIVLIFIVGYMISYIMNYDIFFIIISLVIVIKQILTMDILFYLYEFIFLLIILTIKNVYKAGLVKKALTKNICKNNLEEGMILAYPLYIKDNKYYFNKESMFSNIRNNFSNKDKGELVCEIKASGLSSNDVSLIKNNLNQDIPIKEGLSFAPFILSGLFITFFVGNTFDLMVLLLGMI